MDSPFSANRCALCINRSRSASARVLSPTVTYHWSTGNWLTITVEVALADPGRAEQVDGLAAVDEAEFGQRFTGVQVQLLAHVLVRHRVIMVPVLDMVINVDGHRFDGDVAVGVPG